MKLKNIFKYIGIFILLIGVYFGSLSLISMIPSSRLKENVKQSAIDLKGKGESQVITLPFKHVYLFQFTNALMINTAYSIDANHPIEAMLTAKKNYIPGVTQIVHQETPKDLQSAQKYYKVGVNTTDAFQTLELYDTVYENDLYESFEYARYWHGYLVYLRPLLVLFNYHQITVGLMILFLGLLLANAICIYKKLDIKIAMAFVISYIAIDGFFITKSLNEITCFIMALIFSLYILLRKNQSKNIGTVFFIIGSVTNFFDFLTNPIVTFGMPILIYLVICDREKEISWKESIKIYIQNGLLWIAGYGCTWIAKWVLTDMILHRGIIQNALEQIVYRTHTHSYTLANLKTVLRYYLSIPTILLICVCVVLLYISGKSSKKEIAKVELNLMMIPIIYYGILVIFQTIMTLFIKIAPIWNIPIDVATASINQMIYRLSHYQINDYMHLFEKSALVFLEPTLLIISMALLIDVLNIQDIKQWKMLKKLKSILPYAIGMMIPFVWYMVLLNHSIVHAFFTYRDLMVSIFASFLCILELQRKIKEE